MKSDSELLHFVLEQIGKLEGYLAGRTLADFENDEQFYDACVLKVLIIGEYATKVSRSFKAVHPEIEWELIKAARNFYIHEYGDITPARIWETIQENIPVVKRQFQDILANE